MLGGVDVEFLSREGVNLLLQRLHPLPQGNAEVAEGGGVHLEAVELHLRQHGAKGQLHLVVESGKAEGVQFGGQNLIEGGDGRSVAAQGGIGLGVLPQGGEGACRQVGGGGELRAAVGHEKAV